MPMTVGALIQMLLEHQQHGEGTVSIENSLLILRDEWGAVSMDLTDQLHLVYTEPSYKPPQAKEGSVAGE